MSGPRFDPAAYLARSKRMYQEACVLFAECLLDERDPTDIETARRACVESRAIYQDAWRGWQRSLGKAPT